MRLRFASTVVKLSANPASALARSAHDLHGICDVAPFHGFIRIAFRLTGLRVLRSLRNRLETMLLKYLPRDGVNP